MVLSLENKREIIRIAGEMDDNKFKEYVRKNKLLLSELKFFGYNVKNGKETDLDNYELRDGDFIIDNADLMMREARGKRKSTKRGGKKNKKTKRRSKK